jgi:hypothetical protein
MLSWLRNIFGRPKMKADAPRIEAGASFTNVSDKVASDLRDQRANANRDVSRSVVSREEGT